MRELQHGWGEVHRPEPPSPPVRVYVWEVPVRVSHWFIFLSVVILSFTGYYMHNPFLVATSGTTFAMATVRFIHVVAGFVFIGAFLLRMYWFFQGNEWSNWREFLPVRRRQWRGMGNMLAYYTFLRKDLVHRVGHNALAAVTYLFIFTLMLIEILTGLALYGEVRGGWLLGALSRWLPRLIDIQNIRLVHFGIMFGFFAFVIHHVYSAVLVSWEERNGLIESHLHRVQVCPGSRTGRGCRRARGGQEMSTHSRRTVVLGLGNILHSDDGVGARAAECLRRDERVPAEVAVIEGGTLGLELLNYLWGCSELLVLDAVDVGQAPGTMTRISGADLDKLPGDGSVHHLGLADLLAALRMLGKRPPEVSLLGVQPATTDWGTTLSPPVAAALGPLVEAAVSDLSHGRPMGLSTKA